MLIAFNSKSVKVNKQVEHAASIGRQVTSSACVDSKLERYQAKTIKWSKASNALNASSCIKQSNSPVAQTIQNKTSIE
jgi:hypothetical protein